MIQFPGRYGITPQQEGKNGAEPVARLAVADDVFNVGGATVRTGVCCFFTLHQQLQQFPGPFHLYLMHHELNAADGLAHNRINGHRMLIHQPAVDAFFLQQAQLEVGINVIVEGVNGNKAHGL